MYIRHKIYNVYVIIVIVWSQHIILYFCTPLYI